MTSTHTVRVGGKVFAVQTGGAGIPLLLLHAFPLDHGMWEAQAPLAESVRMIVPDQRGFGRTPSDPPIASIAAMADDAVAVLDALHVTEPAFVCGVSMGGYVAQHVAARYPERVRGLILCDTKFAADSPEARAGRAGLSAKVGRRGAGLLADTMLSTLLAQSDEARAQPRRTAIEDLLRQTIARQTVATIQAALAAMGDRPDMTDTMRRLAIPTLLVVGEEDTFTPPAIMQRMESILPDARLLIVPRAGHMVPLEAPEVFNAAVVEFLRAVVAHDAVATPDRSKGAGAVATATVNSGRATPGVRRC
ncbi:MAG: alpha/beta fold hydrolase [Planctomycetota bacterium]|jgi:pimeloyl-ACP methyl ester carboxylesterase|nr:alpha/beta fold hydrolase [Planctomycetota bacterium]